MNYFAHGYAFVDDPWFMAGTAVPDWLNVSDRGVRVRARQTEPWLDDAEPRVAALHEGSRGITPTTAGSTAQPLLPSCPRDSRRGCGMCSGTDEGNPAQLSRPYPRRNPARRDADRPRSRSRLERYYQAVETIDPAVVEQAVNRISPRPAVRLAGFDSTLCSARDSCRTTPTMANCAYRLNQVLRRVRLPALPERLSEFLPEAR